MLNAFGMKVEKPSYEMRKHYQEHERKILAQKGSKLRPYIHQRRLFDAKR